MKKIISITLTLLLLLNLNAYALDSLLVNLRDRILEESRQIRDLLKDSKDVIILNAMWNSCNVTITQLAAYFFMIGIFNTIEQEDLTEETIVYLEKWLSEIEKVNTVNIKNLKSFSRQVDSRGRIHVEKLKMLYNDLNTTINSELKKISLIKDALKIR
jgi:hypothetical protein